MAPTLPPTTSHLQTLWNPSGDPKHVVPCACLCRKGRVKFCPACSLGKWAINVCWMNGWIMRSLCGKPPSKPTRLLTSMVFLPGGMKCTRVGKQRWLHGFVSAPESIDWTFLNDGFYELYFNSIKLKAQTAAMEKGLCLARLFPFYFWPWVLLLSF